MENATATSRPSPRQQVNSSSQLKHHLRHHNQLLLTIILFLNIFPALLHAASAADASYKSYTQYTLDALPVIAIDDVSPLDVDVIGRHDPNLPPPMTSAWHRFDCLAKQNRLGFADRQPTDETDKKLAWTQTQLWNVTWFRYDDLIDDEDDGVLIDLESELFRINSDGSLDVHEDSAKDSIIYMECLLEYNGHRRQSLEKIRLGQFRPHTDPDYERQTGWATSIDQLKQSKYKPNKVHSSRQPIKWRSRRAKFRVRNPKSPPEVKCYNGMKSRKVEEVKDGDYFILTECDKYYPIEENSAFALHCDLPEISYTHAEVKWFRNNDEIIPAELPFHHATDSKGVKLDLNLVNGRLHLNRAVGNNTSYGCEVLGRRSRDFLAVLHNQIPSSPINREYSCFFPGLLDAVYTRSVFDGDGSGELSSFYRRRAGEDFVAEVLCQPPTESPLLFYLMDNREIFFNETLHQRLYNPGCMTSDKSRAVKYAPQGSPRQHLSPSYLNLDLRGIRADKEVMFKADVEYLWRQLIKNYYPKYSGDLGVTPRFNFGFTVEFYDGDGSLVASSFVDIITPPSVVMQYRRTAEMNRFQSTAPFDRAVDITEWSARTEYGVITEDVVLTCHVQGARAAEWKYEWLHDGEVIEPTSAILRQVKKISDYRSDSDIARSNALCGIFFADNETEIFQCIQDQSLFGFLPFEGVEVTAGYDGDLASDGVSYEWTKFCKDMDQSNRNSTCIKTKYDRLEVRYTRMDLHLTNKTARGSYQCRVTTDEESVIQTFVFFDAFDDYFTPAAISLTPNWVETATWSDITHHIDPLRFRCRVDGLSDLDIRRFEYDVNKAQLMGDMLSTAGHWPEFFWAQNGKSFYPGMGNRFYRMQTKSFNAYYQERSTKLGRWDQDDGEIGFGIWETDKTNVFLAERDRFLAQTDKERPESQGQTGSVTITSQLDIRDFTLSDSGEYTCTFDQATASLMTPSTAPASPNAYPLVIETAVPTNPILGEAIGVTVKWSLPFRVCKNDDDCSYFENDCSSVEFPLSATKLKDAIQRKFTNSDTRFDLILYPRRPPPDAAFTPPRGHSPVVKVEIRQSHSAGTMLSTDGIATVYHMDRQPLANRPTNECVRQGVRCTVDDDFLWTNCRSHQDVDLRLECERYRRSKMTRITCGCTFIDPPSQNRRFQHGVDYEVQVRVETGRLDLGGGGFKFTEHLYADNRPIVTIPLPLKQQLMLPPAQIDDDQSPVVIDGIAFIHWTYDFELPKNIYNEKEYHPVIEKQTLVWGPMDQNIYLTKPIKAEDRKATIGPFSPHENLNYIIWVETTYKSMPGDIRKSINFFIPAERVDNYHDCEYSNRGAPVHDLTTKPEGDRNVTLRYRAPTLNRNEFIEMQVYSGIESKRIDRKWKLNMGRVKPEKNDPNSNPSKCSKSFTFSKPRTHKVDVLLPITSSYGVSMSIFDFRRVESEPAYAVYIPSEPMGFEGVVLPTCDMLLTSQSSLTLSELELTWICPNHINVVKDVKDPKGRRKRPRKTSDDNGRPISFYRQLEKLEMIDQLFFELRWSYRSETGNWHYIPITFKELAAGKNETVIRDIGTIVHPFKHMWNVTPPPKSSVCDRTIVQVRFVLNSTDPANYGRMTSNFSNEISFDAPDDRSLKQLIVPTVIYQGNKHKLLILPDAPLKQLCDEDTYLQLKLRHSSKDTNEFIGCFKLEVGSTNQRFELARMYSSTTRATDTLSHIIGDVTNSSDCVSYEFTARLAILKSNRIHSSFDCAVPEANSEFHKTSQWTNWATVMFPDYTNHICKELKDRPTITLPDPQDSVCDFKFYKTCLETSDLLIILSVVVVTLLLILVAIIVCVCRACGCHLRQPTDANTGGYLPAAPLHNGRITAKPYKEETCSRRDEIRPLVSQVGQIVPNWRPPHAQQTPQLLERKPVLSGHEPTLPTLPLDAVKRDERFSALPAAAQPLPAVRKFEIDGLPYGAYPTDDVIILESGDSFPSSTDSLSSECSSTDPTTTKLRTTTTNSNLTATTTTTMKT